MSQKEKTIRDLDPRDIKLSTIAKFFGGIWTLFIVGYNLFMWGVLVAGITGQIYLTWTGGDILIVTCISILSALELKYKFIKLVIQKIFS